METRTIGRAGVHTINDDHAAVAHLRALADRVGEGLHTVCPQALVAIEIVRLGR